MIEDHAEQSTCGLMADPQDGQRFAKRIFTPAEITYCERLANRSERYATRFAALVLALLCMPEVALSLAAPPPPASPPIRLDRKTASHMVQDKAAPEYPALAKINYIRGRVRLKVEVAGDGKVVQAHVVHGNPILAASALKAIRSWIYHPLVTRSGPSPFLTTVELKFAMEMHGMRLPAKRAESDFSRQIKPPEVIGRPPDPPPTNVVHMRLLLNDQGQVIDSESSPVAASDLETARKSLQGWTFRPAHWGNLPIPWYLDVDVPISGPSADRAAADPGLR
jgi:TonB family protein